MRFHHGKLSVAADSPLPFRWPQLHASSASVCPDPQSSLPTTCPLPPTLPLLPLVFITFQLQPTPSLHAVSPLTPSFHSALVSTPSLSNHRLPCPPFRSIISSFPLPRSLLPNGSNCFRSHQHPLCPT
eukprot:2808856-Rhodomonas_salina.2